MGVPLTASNRQRPLVRSRRSDARDEARRAESNGKLVVVHGRMVALRLGG
jgi:hypothetical protein